MKHLIPVFSIVFLGLVAFLSLSFASEKEHETSASTLTSRDSLPQMVRPVPMEETYTFAGERVPTENFDVYERLDRELTVNSYYHSSTIQIIKRSKRYFEVIEPILRRNGIPDDFKYLAVAESGLRDVTSPAGAKGIWQFMRATGRQYGLEVNADIDERYHLELATEAAAKYLLDLKKRMGSWTLVAASYNAGENKIDRLLSEQRAENYYELNLNQETMRYVFRIVALKTILSNPEKFGFQVAEDQYYPSFPEVIHLAVNETVPNLGDFALKHNIDYRTLKVLNPWMVSSRLPNASGKQYLVRLPG